jgi:CheY-like chemotaxis protein
MTTNTEADYKVASAPTTIDIPLRFVCIFKNPAWFDRLVSAAAKSGHQFFRAKHGMHGYWLAMNESPDVIVTDVPTAGRDTSYLVDCLQNDPRTAQIPVVVLSELAITSPTLSELQITQRRIVHMPIDEDPEKILTLIGLIASIPCDSVAQSVDAVFSEIRDDVSPLMPFGRLYSRTDTADSSFSPARRRSTTHHTNGTASINGSLLKQDPPHVTPSAKGVSITLDGLRSATVQE